MHCFACVACKLMHWIVQRNLSSHPDLTSFHNRKEQDAWGWFHGIASKSNFSPAENYTAVARETTSSPLMTASAIIASAPGGQILQTANWKRRIWHNTFASLWKVHNKFWRHMCKWVNFRCDHLTMGFVASEMWVVQLASATSGIWNLLVSKKIENDHATVLCLGVFSTKPWHLAQKRAQILKSHCIVLSVSPKVCLYHLMIGMDNRNGSMFWIHFNEAICCHVAAVSVDTRIWNHECFCIHNLVRFATKCLEVVFQVEISLQNLIP